MGLKIQCVVYIMARNESEHCTGCQDSFVQNWLVSLVKLKTERIFKVYVVNQYVWVLPNNHLCPIIGVINITACWKMFISKEYHNYAIQIRTIVNAFIDKNVDHVPAI